MPPGVFVDLINAFRFVAKGCVCVRLCVRACVCVVSKNELVSAHFKRRPKPFLDNCTLGLFFFSSRFREFQKHVSALCQSAFVPLFCGF